MTEFSAEIPLRTFELVRAAHGGDRAARDELFARYLPRVRGLVALRMGERLVDFVDRDDVVQEAMLRVFDRLDQFRADEASQREGGFVCWVASLVHSRVVDAFRAAGADKRGGGSVRRTSELSANSAIELRADGAPTPSAIVSKGELDPELERGAARLVAASPADRLLPHRARDGSSRDRRGARHRQTSTACVRSSTREWRGCGSG